MKTLETSIAPADMVDLLRYPIEDITNTRQIVDVYLRGVAVEREALSQAWLGS